MALRDYGWWLPPIKDEELTDEQKRALDRIALLQLVTWFGGLAIVCVLMLAH